MNSTNTTPKVSGMAYICSPLRPRVADPLSLQYTLELCLNQAIARVMCLHVLMTHKQAPFAPHLLYPQFLNPADGVQDALGQAAGHVALRKCDYFYYLDGPRGISQGMRAEMDLRMKAVGSGLGLGDQFDPQPLTPEDFLTTDEVALLRALYSPDSHSAEGHITDVERLHELVCKMELRQL